MMRSGMAETSRAFLYSGFLSKSVLFSRVEASSEKESAVVLYILLSD